MGSLVLFDVVINAFSSGNQGFICSFSYTYVWAACYESFCTIHTAIHINMGSQLMFIEYELLIYPLFEMGPLIGSQLSSKQYECMTM
jgi:hypothetical protein